MAIITRMNAEYIQLATVRHLETFTSHQQRVVEKTNLLQRALVEADQEPLNDDQALVEAVIVTNIDEIAVALMTLQGRVTFDQVVGMMRESWAGLCAAQSIAAMRGAAEEHEEPALTAL